VERLARLVMHHRRIVSAVWAVLFLGGLFSADQQLAPWSWLKVYDLIQHLPMLSGEHHGGFEICRALAQGADHGRHFDGFRPGAKNQQHAERFDGGFFEAHIRCPSRSPEKWR